LGGPRPAAERPRSEVRHRVGASPPVNEVARPQCLHVVGDAVRRVGVVGRAGAEDERIGEVRPEHRVREGARGGARAAADDDCGDEEHGEPPHGPTVPRLQRTYTNPVYADYFADPFVLRHEGRYYAYGTAPFSTRTIPALES